MPSRKRRRTNKNSHGTKQHAALSRINAQIEALEPRIVLSAAPNDGNNVAAGLGPVMPAVLFVNFNVSNASTTPGVQTTSGLVLTNSTYDGAVSFYITNITGGSLFLNDGTTPVTNGEFLTLPEGQTGLRFTPTANSQGGSFDAQQSTTTDTSGLIGERLTASIKITSTTTPTSFTWVGGSDGTS